MDVQYVKSVFVAKNCDRTDLLVAEVIDGDNVTGVQVMTNVIDTGAVSASYYGVGELVITDESGLVLDATSANDKTIPAIKINQRSYDGEHRFGSKAFEGAAITGFDVSKYIAPSECVVTVSGIDATLTDFAYTVKIRKITTLPPQHDNTPVVKSFVFRSAAAGSTATEIVAGLVTKINRKLNVDADEELNVEAFADTATTGLIIRALPKRFEVGKFSYGKFSFTVDVNFTATIGTNLGALHTYDGTSPGAPYAAFTEGNGTWEQVAELEWSAKGYTGANRYKNIPDYRQNTVSYDTQKYEDDGITLNRYDLLNVNWIKDYGGLGRANQAGSTVIALPVDDNATSQAADIIATLVAYIITAHGLGVVTPTLT